MFEEMKARLDLLPGDISVYLKNMASGETFAYNANRELNAASVIKVPVMLEAYRAGCAGEIDLNERLTIRREDIMPSCGVLNQLSLQSMSISDLVTLMIIVSDNTAANLLIDRLGIDQINRTLRAQGLKKTTLRRKLFDAVAAAQGIQNTITAGEIGILMEKICTFDSVTRSPDQDRRMLQILSAQRLNGKIPFYLHGRYIVAHKTGEDDGITHDAGIVLQKDTGKPVCVMSFASEHTCVPDFERVIQDFSRDFTAWCEKK